MKNYKFQLSPTQEKNLENVVLQNGKPLFAKDKTTEEKIIESIIFGVSATLILTFVSAIIILITNLLNY